MRLQSLKVAPLTAVHWQPLLPLEDLFALGLLFYKLCTLVCSEDGETATAGATEGRRRVTAAERKKKKGVDHRGKRAEEVTCEV
jgi:hypothetical protein